MTTKPTPSLKEEIELMLYSRYPFAPEFVKEILSACVKAIERAEPEKKITEESWATNNYEDARALGRSEGYNNGVSDYKQRLLAEVK